MLIVIHRQRNLGLWLSELGSHLLGGEHAPAGTKRISILLRHPCWEALAITDFLGQQAEQALDRFLNPQDDGYVILDESVIEKPASLRPELLCVRCAPARRAA